MKSRKLVLINWIDPACASGWNGPHEANDRWGKTLECKSVGWIIKEDKQKVMIASSISPDELGDLFVIPKVCINKITPLIENE